MDRDIQSDEEQLAEPMEHIRNPDEMLMMHEDIYPDEERFSEAGEQDRSLDKTTSGHNSNATDDHNPSLLGLPPELRTMIYEHLLTFQGETNSDCWPQILATCRQINDEATNVLYSKNVLHVHIYTTHITAQGHLCGSYFVSGAHRNRRPQYHRQNANGCCIQGLRWHVFLTQVTHLKVDFLRKGVTQPSPARKAIMMAPGYKRRDPYDADLNRKLYSLCSYLASGHCLKSLELDIGYAGYGMRPSELEAIARPLMMLGTLDKLVIRFTDEGMMTFRECTYTNAAIKDIVPDGSALAPALALFEEAEAHTDFAEAAQAGREGFPYAPKYPKDWRHLISLNKDMNTQLNFNSDFYDGDWEADTRALAHKLQQALEIVDLRSLLGEHAGNFSDATAMLEEWKTDRMADRQRLGWARCGQQAMTDCMNTVSILKQKSMSAEERQELWEKQRRESRGIKRDPLASLVIKWRSLKMKGYRGWGPGDGEDGESEYSPSSEEEEDGRGDGDLESNASGDQEDVDVAKGD